MQHPDALIGDNDYCPLEHHFTPGLYVRQITIPAGTTLVGKIHRESHPIFLLSGKMVLCTEDGDRVLEGPQMLISKAGDQRAAFTITDVVWITVHANPSDTQELHELERLIIAPTFDALESPKHNIISFFKKLFRLLP